MKLSSAFEERLRANAAFKNLFERARAIVPVDAGHDFSHMLRVAEETATIYAREIQARENRAPRGDELDACFVAALLHDCVPIAKNSPLRKESSRLASEKSREWLKELNWDAEQIETIAGAIHDHSYSSGRVPTTLLGESLQDADRLESLGVLGIYRTIATGIAMGASFFHDSDPWAEKRPLDDGKYSVDHFFNKLFKLHTSFRTEAARIEAGKRTEFMKQFIAQLKHELHT